MKKGQTASPQDFFRSLEKVGINPKSISQVLVVSDLHLSQGVSQKTKLWDRRENFTADEAFDAFLAQKRENARQSGASPLLVINGDFIDFLRITRVPEGEELHPWREALDRVTKDKLPDQNERALEDFDRFARAWQKYVLNRRWWHILTPPYREKRSLRSEARYGLRTQDFKTVYRLLVAFEGHSKLFDALTNWLGAGFPLAIVTGNHDPELDQALTEACLRYHLEELAKRQNTPRTDFSKTLAFFPHGIEIAERIRIEHGHRYEWHTQTHDKWLKESTQEIELPAGSLYNRYLINRMEIEVPYLDNVKPNTRVITHLVKHHPIRTLKLLGQLFRTVWRLMFKRGARRLIALGAFSVARILLPLLYSVWGVYIAFQQAGDSFQPLPFLRQLFWGPDLTGGQLPLLPILLIVVWIFDRICKRMRPHFSLDVVKVEMTRGMPPHPTPAPSVDGIGGEGKRYAICGHTHRPTIQFWYQENTIYLNAGTWTPVFEYDSGLVREDLTMTFVELKKEKENWEAELLRWVPFVNVQTEPILKGQRES